jgi:hypothetical protein
MDPRIFNAATNGVFEAADANAFQDAAAHVGSVNGHSVSVLGAYCKNGTDIIVDAVTGFSIGGKWTNKSTTTSHTPSSMASNTWYYLYGYIDGSGVFQVEKSTTAPDTALVIKDGDATRRFICAFHTYSASSAIREFTFRGGFMKYRPGAMTNAEGALLDLLPGVNTTQSTYTGVTSIGDFVPSWAKFARLRLKLEGGNTTGVSTFYLRAAGDTGTRDNEFLTDAHPVLTNIHYECLDVPVGTSGLVEYKYLNGGTNHPTYTLTIVGYQH